MKKEESKSNAIEPVTMTDRMLKLEYQLKDGQISKDEFIQFSSTYAWFMKKQVTPSLFVACGKDGKPLDHPSNNEKFGFNVETDSQISSEYNNGLSKVIFEGWKLRDTRGGYMEVTDGRYIITFDEHGAYLQPYDSCDGIRLSRVEKLEPIFDNLVLTESFVKTVSK